MIATWMLYVTALSLAFGLAALALEQSLRLFNRPGRWMWLMAIGASVIVPVAFAVIPMRAPAPLAVSVAESPVVTQISAPVTAAISAALPALSNVDRLAAFDRPLLIVWVTASLLTALMLIVGHIGLTRDLARWPSERLEDHAVRVSPDLGPAVVGAWRGVVVLPAWARDLKSDWRALIVRHEAEHVAAADAMLLLVAAFAVVASPWNLPLWWQRARLRDAVELDCDARVIHSGVDPIAYGTLLLDVARRSAGVPAAAIALAAPPSLLSRRIATLISPVSRARVARAVLGVAVGGLLVALACEAPHPSAPALRTVHPVASDQLPWPTLTRTVGDIDYPASLAAAGLGGSVVLMFDIRTDGTVEPGTISPLISTNVEFERAPIPWLLTARFQAPVGAGAYPVRVQQEFDFAVRDSYAPTDREDRPEAPPYPIRVTYLRRGVRGDSPRPQVEGKWIGPHSQFAFGHFVEAGTSKASGFDMTTQRSVRGASHSGEQDIRIPKGLIEAGVQGTVRVDFVAYSDGHVDPASIRFIAPAPAPLQEAVRQSLLAADFKGAFVGTQAASRVAHQTVKFTIKGTGAAARPETLQATTMWDR